MLSRLVCLCVTHSLTLLVRQLSSFSSSLPPSISLRLYVFFSLLSRYNGPLGLVLSSIISVCPSRKTWIIQSLLDNLMYIIYGKSMGDRAVHIAIHMFTSSIETRIAYVYKSIVAYKELGKTTNYNHMGV